MTDFENERIVPSFGVSICIYSNFYEAFMKPSRRNLYVGKVMNE
jgi:hypothetical protein